MSVDKFIIALADWASKERQIALDDSFKRASSDYITSSKQSGDTTLATAKKIVAISVERATASVFKSGRAVANGEDFRTALNDVKRLLNRPHWDLYTPGGRTGGHSDSDNWIPRPGDEANVDHDFNDLPDSLRSLV